MAEQSQKWKAAGGIKSMAYSNEVITGDTAVVEVATTLGNGTITNDKFDLVREEGKWLIALKK